MNGIPYVLAQNTPQSPIDTKKALQWNFAEALVCLCYLASLVLRGTDWRICIYVCAALAIEIIVILQGLILCGSRYGRCTPTGAWLIALIPPLFSCPTLHESASSLVLISCSLASFIVHLCVSKARPSLKLVMLSVWCACGAIVRLPLCCSHLITTFLFIYLLSREVLLAYPDSLSLWEAHLIAQLCFVFHLSCPLFIVPLLCAYFVERYGVEATPGGFATTCAALVWSWPLLSELPNTLLIGNPQFDSPPSQALHFDALVFARGLITPANVILVATLWLPLVTLAVLVVLFFSGPSGGEKTPPGLRKLFHLLAGVVYATGIIVSKKLLSAASVVVLVLFLMLEWARRRGSEDVSATLNRLLAPFRDARDSGELIFTPIALLLGLSLPVWGVGSTARLPTPTSPTPHAWSGVITIALGDSVAALVGRRWGHVWIKWPGSHRTLIGSFASLVSQLSLWCLLAVVYQWPVGQGCWALLVGVFAEAYTEQIDNLAIPLLVMNLLP